MGIIPISNFSVYISPQDAPGAFFMSAEGGISGAGLAFYTGVGLTSLLCAIAAGALLSLTHEIFFYTHRLVYIYLVVGVSRAAHSLRSTDTTHLSPSTFTPPS